MDLPFELESPFHVRSILPLMWAIQILHSLVDFSQKVLAWYEFFDTRQFYRNLLPGCAFDHEDQEIPIIAKMLYSHVAYLTLKWVATCTIKLVDK